MNVKRQLEYRSNFKKMFTVFENLLLLQKLCRKYTHLHSATIRKCLNFLFHLSSFSIQTFFWVYLCLLSSSIFFCLSNHAHSFVYSRTFEHLWGRTWIKISYIRADNLLRLSLEIASRKKSEVGRRKGTRKKKLDGKMALPSGKSEILTLFYTLFFIGWLSFFLSQIMPSSRFSMSLGFFQKTIFPRSAGVFVGNTDSNYHSHLKHIKIR